jgi:Putative adhesin
MNSENKRTIVFLVAIFGIIALAAPGLRSQSASSEQPERFQRSFSISPGGTLDVDNYKGTIHVTGSDTNQVMVDVTKRFDGSSSDRKWWMENIQVNFRNDSNHVSVEVKYPQQNCIFCWQSLTYEAAVELEIHVPRQMNVKVESYKPDIKVASIEGDIRIKSYKSPIEIASTTGAIRIDTYKETIKLRNVAVRGPLDISSYKADAEIEAKSLGETARLESDKGSIVLRIPANTGLDVDFEGGRRASFHSDFPMTSQTGSRGDSVRGTVNQGGTRLHLRTERGSVSLEKLAGGF